MDLNGGRIIGYDSFRLQFFQFPMQDRERSEICEVLKEKFGEKNPDVRV